VKIATEQLAQRLSASLGSNAINVEKSRLGEHAVDGVTPNLICTPATSEQLAVAVRICAEAEAAIAPWGGGTAMILGNAPHALDIVIKTTRLNQLIEHDPANLTVTVQCGVALNALQGAIAPEKQFLPCEPPLPERSTIGGIVAANLNGPRRGSYGSVRDLVIGMKAVLASGESVRAGGKVVKNVAGYDMCKLFTGSLGTLAIITEITMRVAPIPACSATVIATGTLTSASECAIHLSRTNLLPTAIYLCNTAGTASWQLLVSFDGFAETVARQINALTELTQRLGLTQEIVDDARQQQRWQEIADLPVRPGSLVYRLTVPRAALMQTISTIANWQNAPSAEVTCADGAMGCLWLVEPNNRAAIELFPRLVALAQQQRGHAIVFAAPASLKQSVDVWGPPTPAHSLMRRIKQEFDPTGLFNRGRFVSNL